MENVVTVSPIRRNDGINLTEEDEEEYEEGTITGFAIQRKVTTPIPTFQSPIPSAFSPLPTLNNFGFFNPQENLQAQDTFPKFHFAGTNFPMNHFEGQGNPFAVNHVQGQGIPFPVNQVQGQGNPFPANHIQGQGNPFPVNHMQGPGSPLAGNKVGKSKMEFSIRNELIGFVFKGYIDQRYGEWGHPSPPEMSSPKEMAIKNIFDIALTAIAFLSFGIFVLQVIMCITMVLASDRVGKESNSFTFWVSRATRTRR